MRYLRRPPPWHATAAGSPSWRRTPSPGHHQHHGLAGRILAGLATLFLTIGGIRYVMAGGDPAEVAKARVAFRSARPSATAWPSWPRSSSRS